MLLPDGGAPTSVECIHKEGPSSFMFPSKSVIRYDFPARGSMPAVKLFWHDGLTETPKIPGVPEGELLGDLPEKREPRGTRRPDPPPYTGFVGDVFDYEKFRAVKSAVRALYDSLPDLDAAYRRDARKYLEEVYSLIGRPDRVKRTLVDGCTRAAGM